MFDSMVKLSMVLSLLNPNQLPTEAVSQSALLSKHTISLEERYPNQSVNQVFKDNILLNLSYLSFEITEKNQINWEEVEKPKTTRFILSPGQTFSYHDDVLPEYKGKVSLTTNAHFNATEGFKSDGYLYGDGVCHLASLINWAARDASLEVVSPTRHDFANIPGIPKEYGISIYALPGEQLKDQRENLYITNNYQNPVMFEFNYDGTNLDLSVWELK